MEFYKLFVLFSLLITVISINVKNPVEIEETVVLEDTNFEYKEKKENIIIYHMKELINQYVESKNWTQKKQLDDNTFIRLFIYVTSNSLFKKSTREQLNALAEKIVDIHKRPIIIKDIKKYFDYNELIEVYKNMFGNKNLDL